MLIHDIIKIHYSDMGYLPGYPYHLISDIEMCDAFISADDTGYFFDNYPLLNDSLSEAYTELVTEIKRYLQELKTTSVDGYAMPDWVYSYMLGVPISINSDKLDIHDLLVPLNIDNIDDIFDADAQKSCYEISKRYVELLDISQYRPPTMFGEPHVLKQIRLSQVSLV